MIGKIEISRQSLVAGRHSVADRGGLYSQALAREAGDNSLLPALENPKSEIRNPKSKRGFTLLELLIVISILVILATIVLPQYQRTMLQAREAVLRDDLFQMRKALDQYAADKGKLPQSLDDLVSANYLREVPVDPMTEDKDWNVITGDDPYLKKGESGVTDVKSRSSDTASDGTTYSEW